MLPQQFTLMTMSARAHAIDLMPPRPATGSDLISIRTDDGWSLKRLHRLIVTSAAYRQSSEVSQKAFDADPDNRLPYPLVMRFDVAAESVTDPFTLPSQLAASFMSG